MTSTATDVAITTVGLRKTYRDTVAVDGLDLTVRAGEVFSLLGPNGAGKSTTVEILEGYRTRDAGEVSVLGTDPHHAPRGWKARLGIVLQSTRDMAELTVAETIEHFATYYPNPRPTDEVVDMVGLTEKRRNRIRALSGGQRRRLDVALGILGRPELIFLDEPTTGFDPEARRTFWALIERLNSDGTTILLTTHYLDEAEHLADRVGVIMRGTLVDVNTPDRLGGRDGAKAVVTWVGPDGPERADTDEPARFVHDLYERTGGEVPGLDVRRPTLEEVYLRMIGGAEEGELS